MKRLGLAAGLLVALLLAAAIVSNFLGTRTRNPEPRNPPPTEIRPPLLLEPSPNVDRGTLATLSVHGRILDQDGLPFADLGVVLDPAGARSEARTDPQGDFRFPDLTPGSFVLDLCADFDPTRPIGERTLAARIEPLRFLPPPGVERFDVGTHVLPRSHPCWFEGYVDLDPDWALALGVGLEDVQVILEVPDELELAGMVLPQPGPGDAPDWEAPPWRKELPAHPTLAPDGTFRFVVETPHHPILVRVRVRREEPSDRLIFPTRDGFLSETFPLPPE